MCNVQLLKPNSTCFIVVAANFKQRNKPSAASRLEDLKWVLHKHCDICTLALEFSLNSKPKLTQLAQLA